MLKLEMDAEQQVWAYLTLLDIEDMQTPLSPSNTYLLNIYLLSIVSPSNW